tara:strand:+ start:221 stop:496 length:276 start_codon:yes stop_codon:yes gene_type:complete
MNTTSPSYYTIGKIEVWDFVRDQDLNFHLGNAIKYICRAGHKDSAESDLKKAIHYLENELSHITDSSQRIPGRLFDTQFPEWESDSEIFDR